MEKPRTSTKAVVAVALVIATACESLGAEASFFDLPRGFSANDPTYAAGVSADGRVVTGQNSQWVAYWTPLLANAEAKAIGELGGYGFSSGVAAAASANGMVLVGRTYSDKTDATMWTLPFIGSNNPTYTVNLFGLPTSIDSSSTATGVSANGSVVVGNSIDYTYIYPPQDGGFLWLGTSYRWTQAGGAVPIDPMAGYTYSAPAGVSADGSIVAGSALSLSGGAHLQAYRATDAGMVGLGYLPGATQSHAAGISGNGQVIFGNSGEHAFRWTASEGMTDLGKWTGHLRQLGRARIPLDGLRGDDRSRVASWNGHDDGSTGGNYDGSMIVGTSHDKAFIWTPQLGMRDLRDYLLTLHPTGESLLANPFNALRYASAISADGHTIAGGYALHSSAWIALVPEPSGGRLAALAGIAFLTWAGRAKRRHASSALAVH